MIIDSHIHAGESLFGKTNFPDVILDGMFWRDIKKAVVVPFKPPCYHLEVANEYMAFLIKQNPGQFAAFGRVDPHRGDAAITEIKRIFEEHNFTGLFLHPLEENFALTSPALRPVLDQMKKYKKPVMIAGGYKGVSHPRQIEYIAGEYPDITFIATSGGQINICGELLWDAEEMLVNSPNVIMETSGIYRRDFIEQMTERIGAHRIIFGSGSPYYNQAMELERIKTAQISDIAKEMILGGNAEKLFGMCTSLAVQYKNL